MQYIRLLLIVTLFLENCFALIDFENEEQIAEVKQKIIELYTDDDQQDNHLETIKTWQGKISGSSLNLSNSNFTDQDLPLLRLLFNYNSIIYLNLENNKLTIFCGIGFSSLEYLRLSDNQIVDFNIHSLPKLISFAIDDNPLNVLHCEGFRLPIMGLRLSTPLVEFIPGRLKISSPNCLNIKFAPEADSEPLYHYCRSEHADEAVVIGIVRALRESNNPAHQAVGFEIMNEYDRADGISSSTCIAKLSKKFNTQVLRSFSRKLPTVIISDEARHYWMEKLQGVCEVNVQLRRENMVAHIFKQGVSDNPRNNGAFYLQGSSCKAAAMALTVLYNHFQQDTDEEAEHQCIIRLIDAFDNCESNQAPSIHKECELFALNHIPDIETIDGFIEFEIIRRKQDCAATVIESNVQIYEQNGELGSNAHEYSRVLSALDGLFNIGIALPEFTERISKITRGELSDWSIQYVSLFTRKKLINHLVYEINKPSNAIVRQKMILLLRQAGDYTARTKRVHRIEKRIKRLQIRGVMMEDGIRPMTIENILEGYDQTITYDDIKQLLKLKGILK